MAELVGVHGGFECFQDGHKDSVVERQVVVGVGVHQPPGQRRVVSGQVALDGVLAEDGDRVPAEGSVPGERLGPAIVQLVGEEYFQEVAILLRNKVLILFRRKTQTQSDVAARPLRRLFRTHVRLQ